MVPEPALPHRRRNVAAGVGLKTVYTDPRFWRLAPLSATCVGSAWALQGLWAAPWLTDVEGSIEPGLVRHLFVMAVALSAGGFLLGTAADRLARRGIGPQALLAIVAALFIATQLALILQLPVPVLFILVRRGGLSAAARSQLCDRGRVFPEGACRTGQRRAERLPPRWRICYAVLDRLGPGAMGEPRRALSGIAYQVAFGVNVALQIAALVWFACLGSTPVFACRLTLSDMRSASDSNTLDPADRHMKRPCARDGTPCICAREARNWRFVALGSTSLSIVIGLTLVISGRTEVVPYVLDVERLNETRAANLASRTPSDTQIAYFLTRFVKNVRSLSTLRSDRRACELDGRA